MWRIILVVVLLLVLDFARFSEDDDENAEKIAVRYFSHRLSGPVLEFGYFPRSRGARQLW